VYLVTPRQIEQDRTTERADWREAFDSLAHKLESLGVPQDVRGLALDLEADGFPVVARSLSILCSECTDGCALVGRPEPRERVSVQTSALTPGWVTRLRQAGWRAFRNRTPGASAGWATWDGPKTGSHGDWSADQVGPEFLRDTDGFQRNSAGYRDESGASPRNPLGTDLADAGSEDFEEETWEESSDADESGLHGAVPYAPSGRRGFRPFQQVRQSWRIWSANVTKELRSLREFKLADRIDSCGRSAYSTKCVDCGADPAKIILFTGCDARACPMCARRAAEETIRTMSEAVDIFEEQRGDRVTRTLLKLETRRARAVKRRDRCRGKLYQIDRGPNGYVLLAAHYAARAEWKKWSTRAASAAGRISTLRRSVRGDAWSWKWLTLGMRWDVMDEANYAALGIRSRLVELQTRLRLLAKALSFEGCAGSVASFEISPKGHVHVHLLTYGPWRDPNWLNKQVFGDSWRADDRERLGTVRIGKVVDRANAELRARDPRFPDIVPSPIRSAKEALREIIKYSFKSPTPLRVEWLAGERAQVTHPKLVAAWQVGAKGRQLRRCYGAMIPARNEAKRRERLRRAAKEQVDERFHCSDCGCELPSIDAPGAWAHQWSDIMATRVMEKHPDDSRGAWRKLLALRKTPSVYAPVRTKLADVLDAACEYGADTAH
jgi:hypothetical protein